MVDEDVVRALVADQFPDWRGLDVRRVGAVGTDNAIFRIGDDLAARFSLRPGDADETRADLAAEAAAMAELAGATTVPTPEPVAIGEAGQGHPLPWSVQTWLSGTDATVDDPGSSVPFAEDLAALIHELRGVDTRGRPFGGRGRGGHLPDHDEWLATCFTNSERLFDTGPLRALWARLRTLPEVDPEAMCHKDLIPPNVLVRDGRLAGVLDCGGFGPADPALDLVAAWHLLEDGPREVLRARLDCSEVQWLRGMAWALQQAMGLVWYYVDSNPTMADFGRRTLERLTAGST